MTKAYLQFEARLLSLEEGKEVILTNGKAMRAESRVTGSVDDS